MPTRPRRISSRSFRRRTWTRRHRRPTTVCAISTPSSFTPSSSGSCASSDWSETPSRFFVFFKDKVRTSTLFLFQGLSVVDNFLLVTVMPLYCIEPFVRYTGFYPNYLNRGYNYLILLYIFPWASISQTATIWLTVLVGVNRYIAVCKPYQAARLCTVRQAKIQLSVVVVFSVLYNVPRFFEYYVQPETVDNATYFRPNLTTLGGNKLYTVIYDNILYMLFMLILPLVSLTLLNILLIRELKKLNRKRAEMQSARQQQDNNVTLVLIIVVLVFIVCQSPALVTKFMWSVLDDTARECGGPQFYFSKLSNLLVITNSSVNFIVYFMFNTRFRQILLDSVLCCRCLSRGQGQGRVDKDGGYKEVRSQLNTTASNPASSSTANHTHCSTVTTPIAKEEEDIPGATSFWHVSHFRSITSGQSVT